MKVPDSMTFRPRSARSRSTAMAALTASAVAALLLAGCTAAPTAAVVEKVATTPAQATTSASIVSAAGSVLGGASATIEGSGLGRVASVTFGGTPATIARGQSNRKLVVTVPAAVDYQPAAVSVSLLDKAGTAIATTSNTYAYTASTPVAKQLEYALTYWKNYNTAEYGNLNPAGGDCANFVSQTLIARGWSMNSSWYNDEAGDDWSPAWGYVPAMDDYFAANASALGLVRLSSGQRSEVALGDIGVFDWNDTGARDHVEVVTAIKHVDGKILIEFASHNDDYAFRDLDNTLTVQHPGASMHFWHLTR